MTEKQRKAITGIAFFVILFYNVIMNDRHSFLSQLLVHKKLILTIFFVSFVVYIFSFARVSPLLTIPYYIWVSCFSYVSLLAIWAIAIKNRIIERDVRRHSMTMAILMIFFVLVRSIKWEFGYLTLIAQLAWYMYYIPHILLPLYLFLIALSLDKKLYAFYQIIIKWLFFLAGCLIALILSNSFHQKIFKIVEWGSSSEVIKYQPLSYSIALWIGVLIISTIAILIAKSKLPHTRERVVLPLIVIAVYIVYLVLYSFNPTSNGVGFVEFMVTECLVYIALVESLIFVGLIPSNSHYRELFKNSPIPMIISDENCVLYKSDSASGIDIKSCMRISDGEHCDINEWRLSAKKIQDGHIYWLNDMSDINEKIKEIEIINQALSQETDLLRDEILLKKKEIILREKDAIYNAIERAISGKRLLVNKIIETLSEAPDARRLALMRVCLIGAYIKRMSNIVLLEEMYENINAIELQNAIVESLFSYRLKNEATHSQHFVNCTLSGKALKAIYAHFEDELEHYFDYGADIEVLWRKKDKRFELTWFFRAANLTPYALNSNFGEQLKTFGVHHTHCIASDEIKETLSIPEVTVK